MPMPRRALAVLVLLAGTSVAQAREAARDERALATRALSTSRTAIDAHRFALAQWPSAKLEADRLGDPGVAHVGVQLPRREAECLAQKAKCWLVLYLPGFDSSAASFEHGLSAVAESLDQRADAAPIVIVVLDGRTRLGGGWYLDSPISGAWESLAMDVLLPAARDALAPGTPSSRTLVMGHSMGGFGALHLAAAHPAEFRAVAAFNPAADLAPLGKQLVAKLEAGGSLPDRAALRADPTGHFYARLLVTLADAIEPALANPSRSGDRSHNPISRLIDTTKHPWRLAPDFAAALARFDPTQHPPWTRTMVFAGVKDVLIPPAELQPLRSKNAELVVTPGDHLSHLAPDFARALEKLAQ